MHSYNKNYNTDSNYIQIIPTKNNKYTKIIKHVYKYKLSRKKIFRDHTCQT